MTTRADVARWLALADAATAGPWEWRESGYFGGQSLVSGETVVADDGSAAGEYEEVIDPHGPDAAFLAASRTAVPAMGEMLERMATFIGKVPGFVGLRHDQIEERDAILAEWRGEVPE